jgi:hypothetical protein
MHYDMHHMETKNRPTPAEVLDEPTSGAASWALTALAEHGYVIVHPDDFPERDIEWECPDYSNGVNEGWNEMRDQVFGVDA